MKNFKKTLAYLAAFVLWTAAVCLADVQPIGPQNSTVGLAGLNQWVHSLTGVHFALYEITDWLGLIPFGVCAGFGVCGLVQWIGRRSIRKVDAEILVLGGFYVAVAVVYAFFETVIVNYRPVLIQGVLEASYPSSTTVLMLCVMLTAQRFCTRLRRRQLKRWVGIAAGAFAVLTVVLRLVSGVHWFSDIVGGVLISAALVSAYDACCNLLRENGLLKR